MIFQDIVVVEVAVDQVVGDVQEVLIMEEVMVMLGGVVDWTNLCRIVESSLVLFSVL